MTIELRDELVRGLGLTPARAHLDLAVGLFTDRKVTLGRAAEIASLTQAEFLQELGRREIPIHYDVDDLHHDLKTLREMAG